MRAPTETDTTPAGASPRSRVGERLDGFQRRHPVLGFPIAVFYKFIDDQGAYLAVLITYYGFLSLFPLVLLLASITGFLLGNDDEWRERIVSSTLNQFPVIRDDLTPGRLEGSRPAIVLGAILAVYGALGVGQAIQNAMNTAWAIPRHLRPNPIRARLQSLLLILTAGITVIGSSVLSYYVSNATVEGRARVIAAIGAVLLNTGVAVLAFRIATARRLRKRDVLPGALFVAAWWQMLQFFGGAYLESVSSAASSTYGVFQFVFGLFAWLLLGALGLVVGVEANVVLAKRLYPRALLTPFTDNVDLTEADKQIYADLAVAQRLKGFEHVSVRYDDDGQYRTSRRRLPKDVF